MVQSVGFYMLKIIRQLIIDHKTALKRAIEIFALTIPMPHKFDNPNIPALIRVRNKFLSYLKFKKGMYGAAWKIVICAMENPENVTSRINMFRIATFGFACVLPDPDDSENFEQEYVNTPALERILDNALPYSGLDEKFQKAIRKIVVCEMEHDPDHRAIWEFCMEEITEEYCDGNIIFSEDKTPNLRTAMEIAAKGIIDSILNGEWQPRAVGWPGGRLWGEPRTENAGNYGGFHGYKFTKLIKKGDE